jgi:hypothetical protein
LSNGSVFEFFGLSDSTGTARSGKSYSSNSDRVIEVENDNLLIEQNYTIQQNRVRFVWVEEAQDITDKSFNLMKNTFRDKESRLIYTMNPTNIYNPIYKMTTISNPDVKSAKINWNDNPYFPPVLKKEMELDKQLLDSMMWDHIWNGEVYSEKAQYFNIQDLKNCLDQKTFSNNGMVYAGVDLATGDGADKSVICVRKSNKILDMIILNTNKEREMAQMIVNAINKYHIDIVAVDNGNIGHSVINELAYLGRIEGIYPIDFGGRATDTKKFINKRNEMYWNLRTQIKLGCCFTTNDGVVLNELVKELSYIVWDTSKEPPQLQNKDRIKKELGHSPDFADAFALTFAVDGVNTNTLKSDEILSIANYKMQENIF